MSDYIIQLYDRNKSCRFNFKNLILSNIDYMINFPGCIVLPGVTKIFQIRKIQKFDKSDTDISDLIIEFFSRDENCQK